MKGRGLIIQISRQLMSENDVALMSLNVAICHYQLDYRRHSNSNQNTYTILGCF